MSAVKVDVHSHLGQRGVHVHDPLASDEERAWGKVNWDVTTEQHSEHASGAGTSIVLAFDAEPVGVLVDNQYVADAVRGRTDLLGFASVNPIRPDAVARLTDAAERLQMRGLKLGPTYQHFHAHDPRSIELLEVADHYHLPVLWHQGTTFTPAAIAEYARPLDLDLIARRFPDLPMWIAHFGHPWAEEAVSVIRRHQHFYLDVSALDSRPWQLARALAYAYEYRVFDRILFGSDYPFSTVADTVDGLHRAAALCRSLGIADITPDMVEQICQRDSLELLGLAPGVRTR